MQAASKHIASHYFLQRETKAHSHAMQLSLEILSLNGAAEYPPQIANNQGWL